jgi:glycosyltransferase involved in cell wall biosynthesis
LFIGDGHLRKGIISDIQKLGMDRRVTFVPDTLSVPQFMLSAMDCFAFPSRYEGLGLVAVEAQAAGLPCIVSDRLPTEVTVDPKLVTVLSLNDPPERWATTMLQARGRRIRSSAEHLKQFYASHFNLSQCAFALANNYAQLVTKRQTVLNEGYPECG